MTFSLKEVVVIGGIIASLAGTWAVTLYKVDAVEKRLAKVEGIAQFLWGAYIRDGRGEIPPVPWEQEQ